MLLWSWLKANKPIMYKAFQASKHCLHLPILPTPPTTYVTASNCPQSPCSFLLVSSPFRLAGYCLALFSARLLLPVSHAMLQHPSSSKTLHNITCPSIKN